MTIRVLIRKRPDRGDLVLYYVDPVTRREVSKTAKTTDRRTAERAAAAWENELAEYFGTGNDGWQHFRDRFRAEHLATLSDKSYASFNTALNHFERLMRPSTVTNIDATTISLFQAALIAEHRKLSSISTYMTHMRAALNWAEGVGMIRKAPRVKLPKQPRRLFMRGRALTEQEYKNMRRACDDLPEPDRWRRFLDLLWLSGLRLNEAIVLSWDSPPVVVDLNAQPYPQILFHAVGHKARRDEAVPMTPDLAAWLGKTPQRDRHGRVAPLPIATAPRVSEQISELGRAAEVFVNDENKTASAHDFRRSFGTRLAPHVMPITLQKIMRHADISTTMRFYVNMSSAEAGRELWLAPNNAPKTNDNRRPARARRPAKPTKNAAKRAR